MAEPTESPALDPHIPRDLRERLEESLWRPIEARSTLEVLQEDPAFLADPGSHPAMFADHGVVHARDVATGLVGLTDSMNGLYLPERPPERVALMQTLGVALAYIHDVGMVDMTPVGRATHALYAAQLAFTPQVDALVNHLLSAVLPPEARPMTSPRYPRPVLSPTPLLRWPTPGSPRRLRRRRTLPMTSSIRCRCCVLPMSCASAARRCGPLEGSRSSSMLTPEARSAHCVQPTVDPPTSSPTTTCEGQGRPTSPWPR